MANKYAHLKNPLILIAVSFLLTICVFYVDEGNYSLEFLSNRRALGPLLFFTVIFSGLPIFLYHYFLTTRLRRYSFLMSMTGYLLQFMIVSCIGWFLS